MSRDAYHTIDSYLQTLGLQKVTMKGDGRGILGQYWRARGFLYHLLRSLPANNYTGATILVHQNTATYKVNRWTSGRRNLFILLRVSLPYM
jgi:hypothetical protein